MIRSLALAEALAGALAGWVQVMTQRKRRCAIPPAEARQRPGRGVGGARADSTKDVTGTDGVAPTQRKCRCTMPTASTKVWFARASNSRTVSPLGTIVRRGFASTGLRYLSGRLASAVRYGSSWWSRGSRYSSSRWSSTRRTSTAQFS
eukprot:Amastigsp_a175261_15.p4 type:complete len:148 gc:universal Amastigsp_a175261_15:1006-563(-)